MRTRGRFFTQHGQTTRQMALLVNHIEPVQPFDEYECVTSATRRVIAGTPFVLDKRHIFKCTQVIRTGRHYLLDIIVAQLQEGSAPLSFRFPCIALQVMEIDRLYCVGRLVPMPPDSDPLAPVTCPGPRPRHPGLSAAANYARNLVFN